MTLRPSEPLPTLAVDAPIEGTPYKVVRCLGEGGMGVVYEVEHVQTRERRALKILRRLFVDDPELEERFLLEVRGLQRLQGARHVVRIFEQGRTLGRPYYVMDFIEGETLYDRLERGPLSLAETFVIVYQLLVALRAVHRAGVVHRDVKPENIMLRPTGEVVLLDFGLVKALTENGLGVRLFPTPPLRLMGTGPYLPPELAYDRTPDERGDLYAAGVVLFECLAGSLPLPYVPTDAYHAFVARRGFPSLSEAGAVVSPELERVVRRATMASPDARYQTAEAFAFDLFDAIPPSELTNHRPAAAQPTPLASPAPSAPLARSAPPAPSAPLVALAPSAPSAPLARPAPSAPPAPLARPAPSAPSAPLVALATAPATPTLVERRPPRPAVFSIPPWLALPLAVASFAIGVALTLAGLRWAGLPTPTVRAIAEPRAPARPHVPTGAAPAPIAPGAPRPADGKPAAVSATGTATAMARPPSASASAGRGDGRAQLEAKLQSGRGTAADAATLLSLCQQEGDEACIRRAEALLERLGGDR